MFDKFVITPSVSYASVAREQLRVAREQRRVAREQRPHRRRVDREQRWIRGRRLVSDVIRRENCAGFDRENTRRAI